MTIWLGLFLFMCGAWIGTPAGYMLRVAMERNDRELRSGE